MEPSFWQEQWQRGQIGFHRKDVNPLLVKHAPRLGPGPARVLVPLCGKTLDLTWLSAQEHEVWGVELVEAAARAYFAERGVEPETLRVGGQLALRHGAVSILVGDFFAVDARQTGTFAAVYDRAALVALPPSERRRYLGRVRALVARDARLLLVSIEHDMAGGPPFSIERASVAPLARGLFEVELVEEEDVLAVEPRFRERGATRFQDLVWAGRAV
jgi:thiopurine S-methyltransferase